MTAAPCDLHSPEAHEYLEENLKVTAIEILAVLCDLKQISIPEEIWIQILDTEKIG